ncbi:hypothetical protein Pcinc_016754 [Petrolisthes cinctipes]|uniref:Uncharacterized protein n=1 Tax=Petrolisthes cinctipes TaxID=88211 RepID=A0AAE1FQH4_PETCI|nr:hypothetical protein Pcinc_016754 [Petrolisthes cinctipes]
MEEEEFTLQKEKQSQQITIMFVDGLVLLARLCVPAAVQSPSSPESEQSRVRAVQSPSSPESEQSRVRAVQSPC